LHHLNTLTETIRWLVIATGQCVNIRSYRLLISAVNIDTYLKMVINAKSTTIMLDVPVNTD